MAKSFSTARVRWMLAVLLFILTPIIIHADAAKFDPLGLLAWTISPPDLFVQATVGYVPLPPLAMLLKANITTEQATGKVTIQYGDIRFTCKPGSTRATVSKGENQQETELPGPPCVNAGTIYIPIRPLLQAFEIEESVLKGGAYQFTPPGLDRPMKFPGVGFPTTPIAQLPDLDSEMYVMNLDGTGVTRLTFDSFSSSRIPVFFPDGKSIMQENGMALSLETGEEWRVFGEDGRKNMFYNFAFFVDGKRVAATHMRNDGGGTFVVFANEDGTEQRVVTDGTFTALSHDDKFLAFRRGNSNFFLYDLEQEEEIALGNLASVKFSPTEPVILVTQPQKINDRETRYFLFSYTYAGPEKGKFTKLPDGYFSTGIFSANFNPDGKRIVISGLKGRGILLATADLKEVIPLIRTRELIQNSLFFSDGKKIMFQFDFSIYTMDVDGKNLKMLSPANIFVENNGSARSFEFISDGRILFYANPYVPIGRVPRPLQ